MIDHRNKCIFVHIPRTAGHTISKFFIPEKNNYNNQLGRHGLPDTYKKVCPDIWKKYFKFTFVRNPYDRFVSIFNMETILEKGRRDLSFTHLKEEFIEFSKKFKLEGCRHHYRKQVDWFTFDYNFIGRYEDLKSDLDIVLKQIICYAADHSILYDNLPKISKTQNYNYRAYYTPEIKEKIFNLYFEDFETFNYEEDF